MMNKKKIFLSLILAALMVLSCVLLGSCEKGPSDSTSNENEQTTAPEETDSEDSSEIKLVTDGIPQFKVIRPDALKSADDPVVQAMKVRSTLNRFCTKESEISTDWTKDGTHDASTLEILVGLCDYNEISQVVSEMKYGDYAIKAVGNKIILLGYTAAALRQACDNFLDICITNKTTGEDGTTSITIPRESLDIIYTKEKTLSSLPFSDSGSFKAYYDAGDDCDEIIIEKVTHDDYDAYVSKLEAAGYKKYVTKDIKDNTFTTLYNDDYTLNVGYYAYEKSIRLIMEKYYPTTLIPLESENKYEVVTTSQVSMLGLEYKDSSGDSVSNGLSMLIRLADGRFIIVDGGFNREKDAQLLISAMKEQSKDYIAKTKTITVAAWIVTHAHGDHNGMINGKASSFKSAGIKVERFLVNFMSDSERTKSISGYSSNWSSGEGGNWSGTYNVASTLGADVITTHVGQDFWFADLRLEVLYTIESYGPSLVNALNTTSQIMKMTFTDPKTKEQTVYMSTGDATGPGFLISNKMYGDYLKSDIVQVAHHGYTTWGTENGTTSAYISMAPATLAWPQGSSAYPNYVDKSYNAVLHNKGTNPNYKETYVAGLEGEITIFPMPYKVGTAVKGKIS